MMIIIRIIIIIMVFINHSLGKQTCNNLHGKKMNKNSCQLNIRRRSIVCNNVYAISTMLLLYYIYVFIFIYLYV